MLSGVPNLAFTIGHTNASWTLKADLVSQYVVRLLRYLDRHGYDQCVPVNGDLSSPNGRCLTPRRDTCCVPSMTSRGPAPGHRGASA